MKVLFIGGTGNISTSCTRAAIEKGIEVVHLNRGTSADSELSSKVTTLRCDVKNREEMRRVIGNLSFDVVVDWIAFQPEDIERDLALFAGRTAQYIFISSASVYHKPPRHYLITESTPAYNPYWEYSQKKIACEDRLWRAYSSEGFPMTIVRPSHTYSDGWMPTLWGGRDFTVPQRMVDGKRIIVHGDGQSLWTLTHTEDFAKGFTGLLGNPDALGETFHITSEESITWDQVHRAIGAALGVEPKIVHIPSEVINRADAAVGAGLLGDKAYSVVFDNSKIRRFVPGFVCSIPFYEGMRRSAALLAAHPEKRIVDEKIDRTIDALLAKWDTLTL